MTARLDVMPKTEQNQIVRTGKFEVKVTKNLKNCAQGIVLLKHRAASLQQQSYLLIDR